MPRSSSLLLLGGPRSLLFPPPRLTPLPLRAPAVPTSTAKGSSTHPAGAAAATREAASLIISHARSSSAAAAGDAFEPRRRRALQARHCRGSRLEGVGRGGPRTRPRPSRPGATPRRTPSSPKKESGAGLPLPVVAAGRPHEPQRRVSESFFFFFFLAPREGAVAPVR